VSVTATCTGGRFAVGGGFQVVSHGTGDGPAILASYPSSNTVWTVTAGPVFKSTTWSVQAYVICVNATP